MQNASPPSPRFRTFGDPDLEAHTDTPDFLNQDRSIQSGSKPHRCVSRFRKAAVALAAVAGLAAVATSCTQNTTVEGSRIAPTAVPTEISVKALDSDVVLRVVVSERGEILAGNDGFAVYSNSKYSSDSGVFCTNECAETWLPVPARNDLEAIGVDKDRIGVIERADGFKQMSFDGLPLYIWSGDNSVGIPKGAGVAGIWFAFDGEGNPLFE